VGTDIFGSRKKDHTDLLRMTSQKLWVHAPQSNRSLYISMLTNHLLLQTIHCPQDLNTGSCQTSGFSRDVVEAFGLVGCNTAQVVSCSLASCRETCMTYTIAVCTVKNCWWWKEELSETCRFSFGNKFGKLMHLVVFIIRNLSRCTVTWTSKSHYHVYRRYQSLCGSS
jgi:hypothetical protein